MFHVTLKFSYKNVPIEITIDATVIEALDFPRLGVVIDRVKKAVDEWKKPKPKNVLSKIPNMEPIDYGQG